MNPTPELVTIESLEQSATGAPDTEILSYGIVVLHSMRSDKLVYWRRHANGGMTRIDRSVAAGELLANQKRCYLL